MDFHRKRSEEARLFDVQKAFGLGVQGAEGGSGSGSLGLRNYGGLGFGGLGFGDLGRSSE